MTASYLDEILEQPAMLQRLASGFGHAEMGDLRDVAARLHNGSFDRVVLTGMGGSLYSAYPSYLQLSQSLPVPVSLVDTSELVQQTPDIVSRRSLMVTISQSGESGELVELIKLPGLKPAFAISITNQLQNSLADWADICLASMAGPEMTVSSKTYTGGLACLYLLTAALRGRQSATAKELTQVADACTHIFGSWRSTVNRVVEFLDPQEPLVFIGRGRSLASAQTAALLTQEASKHHCMALSGGQFRHGPIELVRSGFQLVIFLADPKTRDIDLALIEKVIALGGKVLAVTPRASAPAEARQLQVFTYPAVAQQLTPVMEAVFIQLLQIPLAEARGFVAGQFVNATKVTGIR